MLHAVYHIGSLDQTRDFYMNCLGMKELRYRDIKEEKYVNAFYGYGIMLLMEGWRLDCWCKNWRFARFRAGTPS